jgi:hypothetical protein
MSWNSGSCNACWVPGAHEFVKDLLKEVAVFKSIYEDGAKCQEPEIAAHTTVFFLHPTMMAPSYSRSVM